MTNNAFGKGIRAWRRSRGISQLDLSLSAGVSSRHISFLETGRSQPSREMVLQLCTTLDVPLRQRNELLQLAGYAAMYPENDFGAPALEPFRQIIEQLLRNHEPFPAFVLDRYWRVVEANSAARAMIPELDSGNADIIDLFLAPGPWRQIIENFPEVAWTLVARLRQEIIQGGNDPQLQEVLDKAIDYLGDVPNHSVESADLVTCPRLRIDGQIVRTVSTIAHFGTARDVTLSELRVEFLCPADRESEQFFRQLAASAME